MGWRSTCPASGWPIGRPASTTAGPGWDASRSPPSTRSAWTAFHLVVHDLGGPVGFELAAALPARVRSLTILNTLIEVDRFRRPWVMQPFAWPVIGELWLAAANRPLFVALIRWQGVQDRPIPTVELAAHYDRRPRAIHGTQGRAGGDILISGYSSKLCAPVW